MGEITFSFYFLLMIIQKPNFDISHYVLEVNLRITNCFIPLEQCGLLPAFKWALLLKTIIAFASGPFLLFSTQSSNSTYRKSCCTKNVWDLARINSNYCNLVWLF